ncbi:stage II sporulation protein GA (sporulation sigma-E factor processing peptidase) [Bacillus ectoiniformans]|uniref:sigma-E processing peptidase SpoIIGA n=1 Tax=Bacillus ectoiniformans TaxID=1494429 RepID=UPI00195DEF95|nr:stage II sporulation protein GA (sporulation sigma-E factor processing peptidase) [Bacillus ectoiniformans]
MVLYLDALWLLNFLADSLLLWMTAIFLKRTFKWPRLILGGLIGSLSILAMVTPFAETAGQPWAKLILSLMMVYTVFGYKRFRYFFSNLLAFYFATFLSGGMLLGAHYFISFDMQLDSAFFLAGLNGFGDPVSWLFVMFGLPIAYYFAKSRVDDFQSVKIQYDQMVDVFIHINDCKIKVKGLIDSGNQLQDPISKSPVMLVSIKEIRDSIPEGVVMSAEHPDQFLFENQHLSEDWLARMRFIPAKSVGNAHQLLAAFKPDEIKISTGSNWVTVPKGLVCFTNLPLSSDDQFSCIVHPKMALVLSFEEVS